MLIYLLRHGLTEYNAEKRYQGSGISRFLPPGALCCAGQIFPLRLCILPRFAAPGRPPRCCSRAQGS